MNNLLFIFATVFSLFGLVYFFIAWKASRGVTSKKDYFLAGKNLGILAVTFTLVATQLGSGTLVGTPQKAYTIGLYGIFYVLGVSIGFLLLASGFASRLQSLKVATTAEIFEKKYSSIALKKFASILSIVTLCGILVAQVIALKVVLSSIGVTHQVFFILFWLFIVAYTMVGGLKAVVLTDLFQVMFILVVFGGLAIWSFFGESTGIISTILESQKGSVFSGNFLSFLPVLIFPAMFSLIEQDLAQKFFAAKSKRVAMLSALYASIIMLCFSFIPLYFGIKTRLLNLFVSAGANPLVVFLKYSVGDVVFVLAIFGIIAAITSTADSMLCAVSSNLSQDFDFKFLRNVNGLTLSKVITLVIGLGALGVSYFVPGDVIDIIVSSYTIMVSCLFVSTVFALFKKRLSRIAAVYSVVSGAVAFVAMKFFSVGVVTDFVPVFVSLAGYFVGEYVEASCLKQCEKN